MIGGGTDGTVVLKNRKGEMRCRVVRVDGENNAKRMSFYSQISQVVIKRGSNCMVEYH